MSDQEPNRPGSATTDALFRVLQEIQAEQRSHRTELRDVRSLLLSQVEQGRRLDRRIVEVERRLGTIEARISEVSDDLELMLKSELMGRLGHLEVTMGHRFDDLAERISDLEGRQASM